MLQYPADFVLLLDGGWRVAQGQVPHRDYYSAIGPLMSWFSGFGLWISPTVFERVGGGIDVGHAKSAPRHVGIVHQRVMQ